MFLCHNTGIVKRALITFALGIGAIFVPQTCGQPTQGTAQKRGAAHTQVSKPPAPNQKSTEQQTMEAIGDLLAQELRIQQDNANQSQAEKAEAEQNVAIQRELAKYTRGLFWVGFLQGVVLLGTGVILYRQIVTTWTAERAWLSVTPQFNNMTEAPPEGAATVLYVCSLRNTGRTPARIIETGLAIRRTDNLENLPGEPVYAPQEILNAGSSLLVPGDEFALTTLLQPPMTTAEWQSLRNRQTFLYAYGFVIYLDVFRSRIFRRRREFRFCHHYHVPVPGEPQVEGFQRLVGAPPAYNRAT
jgi:hypothetical protein